MALQFGKTEERRVRAAMRSARTRETDSSRRADRTPRDSVRRNPGSRDSTRRTSEDVELEVRAALYGSRTTGVHRLAGSRPSKAS